MRMTRVLLGAVNCWSATMYFVCSWSFGDILTRAKSCKSDEEQHNVKHIVCMRGTNHNAYMHTDEGVPTTRAYIAYSARAT